MSDKFGVTIHAKPAKRRRGLLGRWRKPIAAPVRGYAPPPPRATKVRLVRFRNMLWLAVLGGGYVGTLIWGTPHLLTTYIYYGPADNPSLSTCNYWGLDSQTVSVEGKCPLFRLLKTREADRG